MTRTIWIGLVLVMFAVDTRAAPATLEIEITGFRNDRGQALIAVFASKRGFPDDPSAAIALARQPIRGGAVTLDIPAPRARQIAVAVIHDEDADNKLDTGWFGRPKEGIGFSRDARGRFGPPSFKSAAVALPVRAPIAIRITY